MLEVSSIRKNKFNLSDYPFTQDIECRILMADFSSFDIQVLEEILYSPLKISLKKIERSMNADEAELRATLKKFEKVGLISLENDAVLVDKEKRKYFEFEITRFDSNFKPDMEFLQGLLKKVPIHVLPTWYATSRTSNNIFESVVEKYLLTPQIFQRYLKDVNLGDPILNAIIHDVYHSPEFKVSSSDIIAKYNLNAKTFEEMILILEFHFACCLVFEKEDDHWIEYVAPFHEWKEYLSFCRTTEAPRIEEEIEVQESGDYAFIDEMSNLLSKAKNGPLAVDLSPQVEKISLLKLGCYENGKLTLLDAGANWLDLNIESRSHLIYRHPNNRILKLTSPLERYVREAEKSIKRVLHGGWVYFDDFIKGVMVPLSEYSVVMLKKTGKQWKYTLPVYSEEEQNLIKATIFDWLYEFGIVTIGKCRGKDCFAVTPFGRFFFED